MGADPGRVDFTQDAFEIVYKNHMATLEALKTKNIGGYHKIMHHLYREAS